MDFIARSGAKTTETVIQVQVVPTYGFQERALVEGAARFNGVVGPNRLFRFRNNAGRDRNIQTDHKIVIIPPNLIAIYHANIILFLLPCLDPTKCNLGVRSPSKLFPPKIGFRIRRLAHHKIVGIEISQKGHGTKVSRGCQDRLDPVSFSSRKVSPLVGSLFD